jgi:hypothetical protein
VANVSSPKKYFESVQGEVQWGGGLNLFFRREDHHGISLWGAKTGLGLDIEKSTSMYFESCGNSQSCRTS